MITKIPFNGKFRVTGAYWQTSGYWSPNKPHTGIDLVGDDNKSVYSTTVGTVALAGAMGNGWGNCVYINDDTYTHLFAHLDSINVAVGDNVTYTTKIGVMGSTGNVTGSHTHYELRKYSNEGKHRDVNTGTRYSIYNVADYMGIPNVKGTYNSSDFAIDEPQNEPQAPQMAYKVGNMVRVSSCYPSANAPLGYPPNGKAMTPAKGCEVGRIIKVFEGTNNPYQVEDWYFVNDGDIREKL